MCQHDTTDEESTDDGRINAALTAYFGATLIGVVAVYFGLEAVGWYVSGAAPLFALGVLWDAPWAAVASIRDPEEAA